MQLHGPSQSPDAELSLREVGLVFAVALLLRWMTVLSLEESEFASIPVGDARSYVDWGMRIAAGEWLGTEVFYQAPLYPYLLGALFKLFGPGLLLPRLLQGLLGATACALLALLGARLGGRSVGRTCGLAAGLYAPWIWTDGLLQKTSFALFLTVVLMTLCAKARDTGSRSTLGAVGLVLGLLILTRENAAILLLPVGLYLGHGRSPSQLLPLALGLVLTLAPVGWRNAKLGGTFLPTASNAGVNLYIGNGPQADGFYVPLARGRGHADYEAEDARALAEAELGRSLSSAEVSGYYASRAFEEMRARPLRALELTGKKALLLCNGEEFMDAVAFEAYWSHSWTLRWLAPLTRFWLLLPLALVGIACRPRTPLSRLFLSSALLLGLSLLPFFVTGRFRMGLVPLLLPFGALGLHALLSREALRKPLSTGVLLGVGLIVGWLPLRAPGDPVATSYGNLASELLRQGEYESAALQAKRALEADPADAMALFNRGVALKFLGRYEQAETHFTATIQATEDLAADGWAELGSLQALRDHLAGAERNLARALALDPGHDMAHYYVGLLRRQQGELDAAAESYASALRRRPRFSDARHNLAHVRLAQERPGDTLSILNKVIELDPDFLPSHQLLALLQATHPDAAIRNGEDALYHAERALALSAEEDPELHAIRAFALAELGLLDQAEAALVLARSIDPAPERWDESLLQIRSGKPFRIDPLPAR